MLELPFMLGPARVGGRSREIVEGPGKEYLRRISGASIASLARTKSRRSCLALVVWTRFACGVRIVLQCECRSVTLRSLSEWRHAATRPDRHAQRQSSMSTRRGARAIDEVTKSCLS